jgi:hypothetical protein
MKTVQARAKKEMGGGLENNERASLPLVALAARRRGHRLPHPPASWGAMVESFPCARKLHFISRRASEAALAATSLLKKSRCTKFQH